MAVSTVADEEYHHVNKYISADRMLEVGKDYCFGERSNDFWGLYEKHSIRYPDPPYAGRYAAKLAYEHLNSPLMNDFQVTKKIFEFEQWAVRDMGMFIRELVFEEVRREAYPQLPSRRTCIWVCRKASIANWLSWLKQPTFKFRVLRVKCSGVVHIGCQDFLSSDSMNYSEYKANAIGYRSGANANQTIYDEIIAKGKVTIVEDISCQFSAQS